MKRKAETKVDDRDQENMRWCVLKISGNSPFLHVAVLNPHTLHLLPLSELPQVKLEEIPPWANGEVNTTAVFLQLSSCSDFQTDRQDS